MTLKVRLATMMIVVLVAVLALQFLLLERDRRLLEDRVEELSAGLDRTSAIFVEHARDLAHRPREFEQILDSVLDESEVAGRSTHLSLVVWADSSARAGSDTTFVWRDLEELETPVMQIHEESTFLRRPGDSLQVERRSWKSGRVVIVQAETADSTVLAGLVGGAPGSGAPDSSARRLGRVAREESSGSAPPWGRPEVRQRLPWPPPADASYDRLELVVNLPVGADADSFYAVQMRVPFAPIHEELAASRRRSLLWLSAVIGVGILGAVLVAGQFTRPIRTLQRSFGRVVEGDLDLEVKRERKDEIGQLTDSFNDMVRRLKQSKTMEHRLAEAERLASVGRLAAGVAHEVRNPLNAILLTMQQMRSRVQAGEDPASFDRYYSLATGEIARLERMVSAFLDLSRAGVLRMAPLDLAESLESSVRVFEQEAEQRGVRVRRAWPAPLPIEGDPSRLPMVWSNLLANALAVSYAGREIVVSAERRGDEVVVRVTDEGPGFSPEHLPHIWDPFYSGRDGGTGLGLAIVRAAVEHHSGRVAAGNGERGARVEVILPVTQPENAPVTMTESVR
jgi:signal transduction histidine kinase